MSRSPILSATILNYVRALAKPGNGGRSGGVSLLPMARQIRKVVRDGDNARFRILADTGIAVPEMCFFSVTWRCDLECRGCYAKSLPAEDNLSPEEIAAILSQTTAAGTVLYAIAGGEPLQVPGLLDILATTPGGLFLLFTNSTLLGTDEARKIASAGNILPVVSIEGDASETDLRRGAGISDAVGSAMEHLRAAHVPFAFSTMVSHRNLEWVTGREYVQSLWDAGARFGFFVDYIPIAESYDPDLVLAGDDVHFRRTAIAERASEQRPMVVSFPDGEYQSGGCMSAGNGFVHIGANGDVEPCTFCHYSTHNLRTSSYLESLNSPFFSEIRQAFSERKNRSGSCMLLEHEDEVAQIAATHGARATATARPSALVS